MHGGYCSDPETCYCITLICQLPVSLLPLSSTPNLITVILSTINSLSLNYPISTRSRKSFAVTVIKAPKSCHITSILHSLHWLRIPELIEYKLLSLTYKVLTTTQPPYLHSLIFIQRPHSTCSSSVVTLARPPLSSSLKITDRSFCYASPCLWNQLPLSLLQPHSGTSSSITYSSIPSPITSSSSDLPLSTSITPSFTPSLKPTSVTNPTPYSFTSLSRAASMDYCLDHFF